MPLAQALRIQFKRKNAGTVLTVFRADGTTTWSALHPGLEIHDLAHYVIERTLALDDAFFGILSQGYAIQDFELPRAQRPAALLPANLPVTALQVEHLVNLLLTERQAGHVFPDFRHQLATILIRSDLPMLETLTEHHLQLIRQQLEDLWLTWRAIPVGGVLDLSLAVN